MGRGGEKGGGVGEGRREIRKKREEGGGRGGEGRGEGGGREEERRRGRGGRRRGGKERKGGNGKDKSRQGKHILNLSGHHCPHETKLYNKVALPAMFP